MPRMRAKHRAAVFTARSTVRRPGSSGFAKPPITAPSSMPDLDLGAPTVRMMSGAEHRIPGVNGLRIGRADLSPRESVGQVSQAHRLRDRLSQGVRPDL